MPEHDGVCNWHVVIIPYGSGVWGTATGLYPTFLVKPQVSWPGFEVALWSSSKFLEKIGDVEIKNGKIKCEDVMRYLAVYKIYSW